jgi:hypothetical protein
LVSLGALPEQEIEESLELYLSFKATATNRF